MSVRECWLLGHRVRTAMMPDPEADILLSWRPLPRYMPVLMAKRRCETGAFDGLTVREATEADMPAIRGLYAMTGGRALLLPVRDGLWTAEGALVAENAAGTVVAYCLGSEMRGMWNIHEWGIAPETDAAAAASAFAAHAGFDSWQLRAEFVPGLGRVSAGECVHVCVPKPFLLGTVKVRDTAQLVEWIESAQQE